MSQQLVQTGQVVVSSAESLGSQLSAALTSSVTNSAVAMAQNALFGPVKRRSQGPRREEIRLLTAAEGVPVRRVFGLNRVAGQIIWITPFKETTEVTRSSSGSKGVRRIVEEEHTAYRYSVSMAIALGEGVIQRIGRVWADGQPLSLADLNVRFYRGTEDQLTDPLIEVVEADPPAYRGISYIVFEDLDLGPFGNRVPQVNFEVERPIPSSDDRSLELQARAITLIPGSGEAVYHTEPVLTERVEGVTRAENVHGNMGGTDFSAAVSHMTATLPNIQAVELIVSWFGTDLRAGECRIEPRVETNDKIQLPDAWSVADWTRGTANEVSRLGDGNLAYGGTPSDEGVRQSIRDLQQRGLDVVFYPFVLMDIPADNNLPDPIGGAVQPAYPWRGRITVADRNSTDQTPAARAQIEAFAARYRVMILHYATLCAEIGGVHAFLIGSELRSLSNVRDETGAFIFVDFLVSLAAEVRTILGPDVLISYAADWSEYSNYRPADGTGDVLFHLDSLWASPNIDFIGIDNYMPLADWRAGADHLDAAEGYRSTYDDEYLAGNIRGGEGYDWYYASDEDRLVQIRTPIADTAHGEDWVFRYKDLWSWWSQVHHDRPRGTRRVTPTAWVPESKPIWMTELGCSATDKGANQPNLFFDPKSSESGRPYFSTGERDDMIQRRFIEAHLNFWTDDENNPVSAVYGGPMVASDRIFLYTWDARPFPDFPLRRDIWGDADNWTYGHWLNGRAGRVPLGELITHLAREAGVPAVDATACQSLVLGYQLAGPMAARDAIEPLIDVYQLDAVERAGVLIVRPRTGYPDHHITTDGFVDDGGPIVTRTRAQEADLPARLSFAYTDGLSDYRGGVAEVTESVARNSRAMFVDTALVLESGEAEGRAAALLAEARAMRNTVSFGLGPDQFRVEAADVLSVTGDELSGTFRVTELTDGLWRQIEGVQTDPGLYQPRFTGLSGTIAAAPRVAGPPVVAFLDIPVLPEGEERGVLHVAAYASPWPGAVAIHDGDDGLGERLGLVSAPSVMGRLEAALPPGPTSRWDHGTEIALRLFDGGLAALDNLAVLRGAGRIAVEGTDGDWEILGYRDATLREDGVWQLSSLLRGLRGTEAEAATGAPAGSRLVVLSDAQTVQSLPPDLFGTEVRWQAGPVGTAPGAFPYRTFDISLTGASARPFAPAHLRATTSDDGVALRWIRRTRIGGDNWQIEEVPLGETAEQYRVRAYDIAGILVEEQVVAVPEALLTADTIHSVSVAQGSSLYGYGRETRIFL
ncbi:glycoside hydrolase/phage tail family protein [Parvularcula sp. LCG005]|uniref:baseplate multidomain protein megatron n=1 Tax=Parvularcula sp. LCG005 TaxID=3078805 RepID=UPI0029431A70|nr:glycoside hydrolase/phage tail family protein [Parvularcula sp. LCG005]WOI54002.1 glycoside hydrolase/phage tail family protein [Parvularcula sp. LCG005]